MGRATAADIRRYSGEIAEFLCDVADVKLIVVACNSAASTSLDELRYRFDVPIVGVIEPGLRAACQSDVQRESRRHRH